MRGSLLFARLLFALCGVLAVGTVLALLAMAESGRRSMEEQLFQGLEANLLQAQSLLRSLGAQPELRDGRLWLGAVPAGANTTLVDELRRVTGGEATIFDADVAVSTTLRRAAERRLTGFALPGSPGLRSDLLVLRRPHRIREEREGEAIFSVYAPLLDRLGQPVGAIALSLPEPEALRNANRQRLGALVLACAVLGFVTLTLLLKGGSLTGRVARGQQELERTNGHLQTALRHMANGLCLFDAEDRLVLASRHYTRVFGLEPEAVAPGMSLPEMLKAWHRATLEAATGGRADAVRHRIEELARTLTQGEPASLVEYAWKDRILSLRRNPTPDGGWVMTYEDITDRRAAVERIEHMARHDPLTGLPNRRALREALEGAAAAEGATLMMVDLDNFKDINDTLGHPLGDKLLCALAERLRAGLPAGVTLARLGGDEFVALRPGPAGQDAVEAMARSVLDAIGAPFEIEGHHLAIAASLGVTAPEPGVDADTLLKRADLALYKAKAAGRNGFALFEPGMDERRMERRLLEQDLRRAIAAEEFELHYQPLVDLASGKVSGCEALMRWHHPERGMVAPGEFIPVAEDSGLILPLGAWALRAACREATRWQGVKVAVNVSPLQLRDRNFVGVVTQALKESGLRPHLLELEVTETALLADEETARAIFGQLRAIGVRIALDDFGTGASNLSYLRSFSFDKVKVDRMFVEGLGKRRDCEAIVTAVVAMGRGLGITTLAEGIETAEQAERLRAIGCQEGQGYLFSRPVPAAQAARLIARIGVQEAPRMPRPEFAPQHEADFGTVHATPLPPAKSRETGGAPLR